jgi:hypothetical protein
MLGFKVLVVTFRVVVQGFKISHCCVMVKGVFFDGLRFKVFELGFKVIVVTFKVVVQRFMIFLSWFRVLKSYGTKITPNPNSTPKYLNNDNSIAFIS